MKPLSGSRQGFTLIELMIVIAIIAIIAAIAIPSLLRSRMAANESSAIAAMRTIFTGEVSFQTAAYKDTNGDGLGDFAVFPELLDPIGDGQQGYIDEVLASGFRQGYAFDLITVDGAAGLPPTFTLTADPIAPGRTGARHFFTDQSGVIRVSVGGPATANNPPMQ